jgi:hypothetical protein
MTAHIEVSNIHVTGSHKSWPDVPMTVLHVAPPKSLVSHGVLPVPQATLEVFALPATGPWPALPAPPVMFGELVPGSSVEWLPEQAETNSAASADQESV